MQPLLDCRRVHRFACTLLALLELSYLIETHQHNFEGEKSERYKFPPVFSRTAAIARTREITQLAQSSQTRQLSGERKVLRNSPSPAVSALRMEALKTYSRMPLA